MYCTIYNYLSKQIGQDMFILFESSFPRLHNKFSYNEKHTSKINLELLIISLNKNCKLYTKEHKNFINKFLDSYI